jgi:hypothetical protein
MLVSKYAGQQICWSASMSGKYQQFHKPGSTSEVMRPEKMTHCVKTRTKS